MNSKAALDCKGVIAPRRRFVAAAAAGGLLVSTPMARLFAMAKEPAVQGLHELSGSVEVSGRAAVQGGGIVPGDVIETGADSRAVYVVGRSVFLQRADTRVELAPPPAEGASRGGIDVVHALRVLAGKLLSVHARGDLVVETPFGGLGIRGTGVYIDVQAVRTYACVCYGTADMLTGEGEKLETVRTRHHESPRYLYPRGAARRIEEAPVVDHTDDELIMLESLVGREPPFVADGRSGNY